MTTRQQPAGAVEPDEQEEQDAPDGSGARVALVTGASGDIGGEIAHRLAGLGYDLGLGCSALSSRAVDVVVKCRAQGGKVAALAADLSAPGGFAGTAEQFSQTFHHLDVLVTCAADYQRDTLASATDDAYDHAFALNTKAVFQSMRWAARLMRRGGRIITVSSLNTALCAPESALYAGSKIAVEAFTRVAAKELGPRGITVNALLPGPVDTRRMRREFSDTARTALARRSPLRRLGTPQDIGGAVAWLVGDDARWVTGQTIRVDGGFGT